MPLPSDGEQVGKSTSRGEKVNGAAVWQRTQVWQRVSDDI